MEHKVERQRVIVAVAVIFDQRMEKILICQRMHNTVLGGFWEFPGGKCNPGETLPQCAVREVAEELGIIVAPRAALPAIEHDYPHARVRLHPFLCQHQSGVPQLLAVQAAMWIEPRDIIGYDFPSANLNLLQAASKGWEHLRSQALDEPVCENDQ